MSSSLKSTGFRAFLATQFLGAFNDNAFKLVVSLLLVNLVVDQSAQSTYVALAGGLFTLPFILFFMYAGFLADRFSKQRIMVWVKLAEVVVMALGGVAFWLKQPVIMIVVVFLMGAQSTFFSPAKYGILPEVLPDEELSRGNGRVQLWTFVAIILGTAAGGQILDWFSGRVHWASLVFVGIAVLGVLTSLRITRVPAAQTGRKFQPFFLRDVVETLGRVRGNRPLFLCVLGNAYFWFVAALFQMNILVYAKQLMELGNAETGYLLTSLALGIGMGSLLAGRWSGEKVEFGLVPLGAIGLGLCSMILSVAHHAYLFAVVILFLLGVCAALYSIPLNAYIQQKSPRDSKGRVLAASGFLSNVGIVGAAGLFWVLQNGIGLDPALTFLVTGLASFLVVGYICRLLPDFLVRFAAWLLTHTFYRITIAGQQHVPREGGALLVCNHVSYADAFLVQSCIQRFIRFIMARKFYESPFVHPISRLMKAIPVSTEDGPKALVASLREAAERVNNGELVCIFAEGAITRTGNMLPFNRGIERVMRKTNAPIIPVYLDRVWGSIFSFDSGKTLNKLPVRMPYPVTVCFGEPMPADSSSFEVRSAIQELGADAYGFRKDEQELLSTRFFQQARRRPFRQCMADSTGASLTYWKALTGAMALSLAIRRRCSDSENVGVLLPNSVASALTNTALTILGRCPVNLNYTASQEAIEAAINKCWVNTVNQSGIQALKTSDRPGRTARLSALDKKQLRLDLKLSPEIYGYHQATWDGILLSKFLKERYGVELKPRRCQYLFHELGFSLKRARKVTAQSSSEQRDAFKKTLVEKE